MARFRLSLPGRATAARVAATCIGYLALVGFHWGMSSWVWDWKRMMVRVLSDSAFSLLLVWAGLRLPAWVGERKLDEYLTGTESSERSLRHRFLAPIGWALGWVKETGMPVYDEQGYYAGFLPQDARRPHTAFRSPLYWVSPYRYQMMVKHLPVAVAHCRLTEKISLPENGTGASGRDFVVLEANAAFHKLYPVEPDLFETSASRRWPQLLSNHPGFFEKLLHLKKGEPCHYSAWFPTLGFYLDLRAVYLGDENFMIIVRDVTDTKAYRSEVLRLYEQMNNRMTQRENSHRAFLDSTDRYVGHASEALYNPYDQLMELFSEEKMPSEIWLRARAVFEQLQFTMDKLRRFAQVSSLNFEPKLVDIAAEVNTLFDDVFNTYQGIKFKKGPLPSTTASPEVVRALLRYMVETLSRFVARPTGSVVEVGVRNDDLDMVYYTSVTNCQAIGLGPSSTTGLMFTDVAVSLQFGLCQRLVYLHGGEIHVVRRTPDSLEIQATLGSHLGIMTPVTVGRPEDFFDDENDDDDDVTHAA
ncbi:hypothetical protein AB4Y45_33750 [Paraburkholderia sp. EG287A]|uniref:hypothetical protein n=1 Tax=Paraburkholderia sp. EG287A TaxID=3237012 RepID=UPI0034D19882